MTEEREKEHAEEYWQKHVLPNVDKWSGLLQLVCTVAAEARKEGIDAALQVVNSTKLSIIDGGEHVIMDMATDAIARLKEQG